MPRAGPALLCGLLLLALAPGAAGQGLKRLQHELEQAAEAGDWQAVAGVIPRLPRSVAGWRLALAAAERAPETEPQVLEALRAATAALEDAKAVARAEEATRESRSAAVRRTLGGWLAARGRWELVARLLEDGEQEIAADAAHALAEARVERGVEPLLEALARLERKQRRAPWDALDEALTRLLGTRREDAGGYRAAWKELAARGGVASVTSAQGEAALVREGLDLLGCPITGSRFVVVLDVSGPMRTQDAPGGGTRHQRACRALVDLLGRAPAEWRVNLVVYSSNASCWRAGSEGGPPLLHALGERARQSAIDFASASEPGGVMALPHALERALEVREARAIYLLTGSQPSFDGLTPVPAEEVLRPVREVAARRRVPIHAIGLPGADQELLHALAAATGGRHHRVP